MFHNIDCLLYENNDFNVFHLSIINPDIIFSWNSKYTPVEKSILAIVGFNQGNLELFKAALQRGGDVDGISPRQMKRFKQEYFTHSHFNCHYNPESFKEDLPSADTFSSRTKHRKKIIEYMEQGGRVLSSLPYFENESGNYKEEFTVKQFIPAKQLTTSPSLDFFPPELLIKTFKRECFDWQGKPELQNIHLFHEKYLPSFFSKDADPKYLAELDDLYPLPHWTVHLFIRKMVIDHDAPAAPSNSYPLLPTAAEHLKTLIHSFHRSLENSEHARQKDLLPFKSKLFQKSVASSLEKVKQREQILLSILEHSLLPNQTALIPYCGRDKSKHSINWFNPIEQSFLKIAHFNFLWQHPNHLPDKNPLSQKSTQALADLLLDGLHGNYRLFPLLAPGIELNDKSYHLLNSSNTSCLLRTHFIYWAIDGLNSLQQFGPYRNLSDDLSRLFLDFLEKDSPAEWFNENTLRIQNLSMDYNVSQKSLLSLPSTPSDRKDVLDAWNYSYHRTLVHKAMSRVSPQLIDPAINLLDEALHDTVFIRTHHQKELTNSILKAKSPSHSLKIDRF